MKKFIIMILLVFITISTQAETLWYRSTSFATASIYNGRYTWSDWVNSNLSISIDLTNDIITVYSKVKQTYYVTETGDSYSDNSGGKQIVFYVVDQDRTRGAIRLRTESNGNPQIYIDFNNVAWVYNVVRTR